MHRSILKHKDKIIDMVNAKIDYIHQCVHDGGHPVMDEHEQDELEGCVDMLEAITELHMLEHKLMEMKAAHTMENPKPHNPY